MASDLEKGLIDHLLGVSALKALVDTRIYPVRMPQGAALPLITVQRISTTQLQPHDEMSQLPEARMQINCYAETFEAVKSISAAISNALDGHRGTLGSGAEALHAFSVRPAGCRADYIDDPPLFWFSQDFLIRHE